jgi:hypothetical protein
MGGLARDIKNSQTTPRKLVELTTMRHHISRKLLVPNFLKNSIRNRAYLRRSQVL